MSTFTAADEDNLHLYINSMRNYVLDPIRTAVEAASADRSELDEERDAFLNFIHRVRELEPEPVTTDHQMPISNIKNRSNKVTEIYQETVLAVDHYDVVYDETLRENAVAELGTDAAEVLVSNTGVTFTPVAKELVLSRAQQRLEKRRKIAEDIIAEQESVSTHKKTVRDLLEDLTGTRVPKSYQEQFESEISSIFYQRQNHLHKQNNKNGHELCRYLYGDQNWCYPVLTSIARLRETTVTREGSV